MFTRRSLLGGVAAAGVSFIGSRVSAQTSATLTAVVQFGDGRTFTYDQTVGVDLGDFVSTIGGFTQSCIRVDVPGVPLTVFFRPDRGSDRAEVVFELGRVFSGPAANLGAYTASIYRGGQLLATVNVPAHYWYSRWRWQSSPRPIVGNVANLISQGLLPPYDTLGGSMVDNYVTTCAPPPFNPSHPTSKTLKICTTTDNPVFVPSTTMPALMTSFTPYTVMGLSDVTPYMPQTGERGDIGMVTEPQAEYICTGAPIPLAATRAQAEAAGTVPWHIRDENTNAPINLRTYPNASWYWDSRVANPWIPTTASPVTIDTAHEPALAYLPYVLTGDPYHLEDMQFAANWDFGSAPPAYRPGIGQSRAFAWYIRNLSQCARVTPATVPSWLLPQSYWIGFLNDNRAFLENAYVNDPSPLRALFRSTGNIDGGRDEALAPAGTWVDPWQEEFVGAVIGWVVRMGFTDWQTSYAWKLGSTIARTNGASGWVRAYATPYRMILRSSPTSQIVSSWSDAWTLTQSVEQIGAVSDVNDWAEGDMTYLAYSRGVLAIAQQLGVPGLSTNLSWATQQLKSAGWLTSYKWRLGSGL